MALKPVDVVTPFGSTHVQVAGPDDAPPLVVLHAKNCSSTMWLDLLPVFTATHQTYLVDSIGELSRSVATRMMRNRPDVIGWLDAVLGGLGIDRCAVVGLSNGAFLGGTYAMARPERVERLAMLAPAGVVSGVALSWWGSLLSTVLSKNQATVERFWFRHYLSDAPSALRQRVDRQFLAGWAGMRLARRDVLTAKAKPAQLGRLNMPLLVVFASHDIIHDGPKAAERARRLLPSAKVVLLENSGHFMHFDQPSALGELLADFLAVF
jgi:pimeloyl-ACP methyl ester carboxylesterase